MKRSARAFLTVPMLIASYAISANAAFAAKPPEVTEDGLVLTKSKRVDLLYKRPDASLKGYSKVWLKPLTVSFSKSWDPKDYGTHGLRPDDIQKIREGVGQIVFETMSEQLTEAKYAVVNAGGEGVLEVEGHVVNLYINAPMPEKLEVGRSKTYVVNAGEMTLVAELRDSVTGTVLARGLDRRKGTETGRMEWATSGWNKAEAKRIAKDWAKSLIKALDDAKEEAK